MTTETPKEINDDARYYYTGGYCTPFNVLYKSRPEAVQALADHKARQEAVGRVCPRNHAIRTHRGA